MEGFGTGLEDLPEELVEQICNNLSTKDLARFGLSNKRFNASVKEPIKQRMKRQRALWKEHFQGCGCLGVGARLDTEEFSDFKVHRYGSDPEIETSSMSIYCKVLAYWAMRFNRCTVPDRVTSAPPMLWTTFRIIDGKADLIAIILRASKAQLSFCHALVRFVKDEILRQQPDVAGLSDVCLITDVKEAADIILNESTFCTGFSNVNANYTQHIDLISSSYLGQLVGLDVLCGLCHVIVPKNGLKLASRWRYI